MMDIAKEHFATQNNEVINVFCCKQKKTLA